LPPQQTFNMQSYFHFFGVSYSPSPHPSRWTGFLLSLDGVLFVQTLSFGHWFPPVPSFLTSPSQDFWTLRPTNLGSCVDASMFSLWAPSLSLFVCNGVLTLKTTLRLGFLLTRSSHETPRLSNLVLRWSSQFCPPPTFSFLMLIGHASSRTQKPPALLLRPLHTNVSPRERMVLSHSPRYSLHFPGFP